MKFRKISASVLAISLILTVNAAAYDNTPESSPASKPALQTSYDRSELTIEEERAIIEQWLEEYPDAVVGTSNDMLVLDTRPWSDFSTESAPACMPGFSMEEYQAEYSTPDEEIETIEEQPPELSLHDKMIIELFNGMNEEQRLEAIENDFLKGISFDAYGVVMSNSAEKELAAILNKILVLDSAIYSTDIQTSYDRSELTIEEERAIIKQWLEEYPDAVVGTSNGMLVLDTRPWSDFSTESAPACMPGFSMEEYQAEYSTPDEEIETIEEQPPELSLHDKMIIELFNGMNEEQRLEAIENDIVLELSMEARHMLLSCMTDTERETAILKYLKYDSNISVII